MKYGLTLPNVGAYSDPRVLANLAKQAEDAGWDGAFIWDTMQSAGEGVPTNDPWIALAAMAMQTHQIRIGTQVAIPPRRRPWKLVREAVTLDHLSNGRLILGVGAGDSHGDRGFKAFGEEMSLKVRGEMLDESLAIIQGLWSGEPFSYSGKHYQVQNITFLPKPVQQPGIPIWIGWLWQRKKPMERAARFEGASPFSIHNDGSTELNPAEIRQLKTFIEEWRQASSPFDIVTGGPVFEALHSERARAILRSHEEAGATWMLQRVWGHHPVERVGALIRRGIPNLYP